MKKKNLKKSFLTKLCKVFILSNFCNSSFLLAQNLNNFSKISINPKKNCNQETILSKVKNWILLFKCNKNISKIENRLNIFKRNFTPLVLKKARDGILILCQDYSEYIFIRNYLWKIVREREICLIIFHEYLSFIEKNKRKNKQQNNFQKIILMTERFYFFNRYSVLNVQTVFFFSLPLEMEYFLEICKSLKKIKKVKDIYSIQNF